MMESTSHNEEMLALCDPEFARRVRSVLTDSLLRGFFPKIVASWLEPLLHWQAEVVTDDDGAITEVKPHWHNMVNEDGTFGALAVDIEPTAGAEEAFYLRLMAAGRKQGLVSGVLFGCGPEQATALCEAVRGERWECGLPLGDEPCHLEPGYITLGMARKGLRKHPREEVNSGL